MLQVVEAGRSVDAGELDVVVSPAVFAELQQTIKTPKDVTVLFRVGKGPKGMCALRFKCLEH